MKNLDKLLGYDKVHDLQKSIGRPLDERDIMVDLTADCTDSELLFQILVELRAIRLYMKDQK